MIELRHRDFLMQAYRNRSSSSGYSQSFEIEYLETPQAKIPEILKTLEDAGYINLNPEPQTRYWRSPRQQHLLNQFAQSKNVEWFEPLPDEHWPEFQSLCKESMGYAPYSRDLSRVWIQTWYLQLTEKAIDFCILESHRV